ncbi:MAG TPA: response regulator [Bacteroidales bacterium]|nr:response regulator [Bacteroidales bacterium]HQI44880.1 response regulator [Bacteroidales bacterium]
MKKDTKKVLIADDDPDFLTFMEVNARLLGFEVHTVISQKEAEEAMVTFKPDLAIFDLMMENKDSGFILSHKFKKLYPDVPVIIATAVTAETGLVFGLNTPGERTWIKADKYIDKSLRPDQLQKEIKSLMKM